MKDGFGRQITYLRLSVTERCNLRCRYCMPEESACGAEALTEDALITVVEAAASVGIRKVRITGGEPLVRKDILSICRRAAAVAGIDELCLTTNGILLPQLAVPLREAGVRRVNISLDTLNKDTYKALTRRDHLSEALLGLEAALTAGFDKVKVNAVLLGGVNDGEIAELADLTRQYPVDVRFIEWMPMGQVYGSYLSCDAVLQALPQLEKQPSEGVAEQYRLPGAQGCVGLIRPVSRHFCGGCNRIRVTADGQVKPCLHRGAELSLKDLSKEEMAQILRRAIEEKPACHGELSLSHPSEAGRTMNRIGG